MYRTMIAIAALFIGLLSIGFILGMGTGERVVKLSPHMSTGSADEAEETDAAAEMIAMQQGAGQR